MKLKCSQGSYSALSTIFWQQITWFTKAVIALHDVIFVLPIT